MQATGTKLLLTLELATSSNGFKSPFRQFPLGRLPITRRPVGQGFLGAVEQNLGPLGRLGSL